MYRFKQAETEAEFEQIFRLNHSVFAAELGQYTAESSERLVDKFHDKNQYVIALEADRVVAMIAIHTQPPYSVAEKLADPRVLDALGSLAEIRLLAIDPAHRHGTLLRRLFVAVYERSRGHDAIVISGRVEEQAIYRSLGFRPLGPPVSSGAAEFIPMAVRVPDLALRARKWSGV
jgi:hypothetical protein